MEGTGRDIEKKSKNCFLSLTLKSKAQMEIKSITDKGASLFFY